MCAFQLRYDTYRSGVESYLSGLFATSQPYNRLYEAMRYSLLAGGKRIRPVLTLAFCDILGGNWRHAVPFACGLELIHTYSLIHDDLPCMDDDDLRRGKPTCHRVYGETLAVLAGDALQAEAFRLLASAPNMDARQRSEAVCLLASACGADGMVAGQVLDMEQSAHDEKGVQLLQSLKTGAMITAAAELGCIAAGAEDRRPAAADFGRHIGLAFQIRDDMLDIAGDCEEVGKPLGSDRKGGKLTYVDLLGLNGCERRISEETALAKKALEAFPAPDFLLNLADYLADRRK